MTFSEAVSCTPSIRDHLKSGLKALRKADRGRVRCESSHLLGSVDIDSALRKLHPNDARWDYAVRISATRHLDSVVWLEVHPASSLHIDEVLDKLQWLRQWLGATA